YTPPFTSGIYTLSLHDALPILGAGKSAMAAWLAKTLLDDYGVEHVLVLVPWVSIQGDVDKGMLGAFGETMGLDARDRFFTYGRRDRKSTRLNSSHVAISYAVFC